MNKQLTTYKWTKSIILYFVSDEIKDKKLFYRIAQLPYSRLRRMFLTKRPVRYGFTNYDNYDFDNYTFNSSYAETLTSDVIDYLYGIMNNTQNNIVLDAKEKKQ